MHFGLVLFLLVVKVHIFVNQVRRLSVLLNRRIANHTRKRALISLPCLGDRRGQLARSQKFWEEDVPQFTNDQWIEHFRASIISIIVFLSISKYN